MPMGRHPGQTVWWGGAHSACAVVASFCNLICQPQLHPEGSLGRRGGSSNSRVAEAVAEAMCNMSVLVAEWV